MRDILFRGKQIEDGKWAEGFLSKDRDMSEHPAIPKIAIEWEVGGLLMRSFIDTATVGQYIGITDKNGKKIFEGDIVKWNDKLYEVAYITKYARFAGRRPRTVFSIFDLARSEVIGNIHDNPELIDEERR